MVSTIFRYTRKHNFSRYFLLSLFVLSIVIVGYDRASLNRNVPFSPLNSTRGPVLWPLQKYPRSLENPSPFAALSQTKPFKVAIILYHYIEIVTDERDTLRKTMSVYPSVLEGQLKALKQAGYHFILPRDLARAAAGEIEIPEKSIILSFDDGYQDFYTGAYPILKRQSVPAIEYIVYNFIGKNVNYMTEAQIREIAASGLVELGSHTLDHPNLTSLPPEKAQKEITESKMRIEKRFGFKIDDFAYPGGFNNEALQKMVKEAGYLTAVATQPGVANEKSNLFHLPRVRLGSLPPDQVVAYLDKKVLESR